MSPVICFNSFIWQLTDSVEFSGTMHSLCTVWLNAILNVTYWSTTNVKCCPGG